MIDGWIVIPNWEKWQSRRDRRDPWLKDWLDQDDREEYRKLALSEVGLLTLLRRCYARSDGVLSTVSARHLIGRETRQKQWDALVHAGLLVISAAKPQRISRQLAARTRVEVEVDRETPLPPFHETPNNRPTCPDCGVSFKSKNGLAEHVYHSHNGPEPAHWIDAEAKATR